MESMILELIWNILKRTDNRKPSPREEPVVESWSCIRKNAVRFRHIWTIDKFSYWSNDTKFTSKPFTAEDTSAIPLSLSLNPLKDVMELHLSLVSSKIPRIHVDVKVSILDASKKSRYTNHRKTMLKSQEYILFPSFVRKSELLEKPNVLLPNNTLTICCEGTIMVDGISFSEEGTMMFLNGSRDGELAVDFENLLETGNLSDVTLCVGDKRIRAHKTILAARSRVFSAMFEHYMLEKQNNEVIIEDIDDKVFREVLRFIYTGRGRNLEEPLMLIAANKYGLKKLENMCKMALFTNISLTNACEILTVAGLLDIKELKSRAINFINLNANTISKTKEFQSMITSYPNLVVDLYGTTH